MRTLFSFKWIALALIVAGLSIGIARALVARSNQQEQAQVAAAKLQEPTVYSLAPTDVVRASAGTLNTSVAINGTVQAVQAATLKSNVVGAVEKVWVREGQLVQAGQALVQLDTQDARDRAAQAAQQTKAALAQLNLAQRQRDNNQALVDQGFISATALATSDANYDAARANLEAARAAQAIAQRALGDSTISAPFTGQVTQRHVKVGERVAVNAPVVDIVDSSQLELEVALPIAQASGVSVGQTATLQLESTPQTISATVVRINATVQASTRSVAVYLRLPTNSARVGEFATGLLTTGAVQGVLVPLEAVRNDQPTPYVQVVRNGVVQHINVRLEATGQLNGQAFAAVRGIAAQEVVLTAGAGLIGAQTAVSLAE